MIQSSCNLQRRDGGCYRWMVFAKEVASGVIVASKALTEVFFSAVDGRLTGLIGLWVGMPPAVFYAISIFISSLQGG